MENFVQEGIVAIFNPWFNSFIVQPKAFGAIKNLKKNF